MAENNNNPDVNENELQFKTSRSQGPGGQNVNKLNTKVTAVFNPAQSDTLSHRQKKLILKNLSKRIDKNGNIRVSCQRFRSQKQNKNHAVQKLNQMLNNALKKKKKRKKTKKPIYAEEKRLQNKKQKSQLKQQRKNIKPGQIENL